MTAYLPLLLAIGATLVLFSSYGWLVFLAYQQSVWWGVGALIPGGALIFLVYHWPRARGPLLGLFVGLILFLLSYPSTRNRLTATSEVTFQSLFALPRSGAPVAEEEIVRQRTGLHEREFLLRQQREKISPRDSAAAARLAVQIEAYNRDLKVFHAALRAFEQQQAALASTAAKAIFTPEWTLDFSELQIPQRPVQGRVRGIHFHPTKVTLEHGALRFQQGEGAIADIEILLLLGLSNAGQSASKILDVRPSQPGEHPEIQVRFRSGGEEFPDTDTMREGYALRIEFTDCSNSKKVTGKIYLCLPDAEKTILGGEFEALVEQ